MKMTIPKMCALGALCLTAFAPSFAENARADEANKDATAQPMTRTLIDRDALRSIEIVTDRHESVAQFFQRQKLALATSPILDGKFVQNAELAKTKDTTKVFVSYPLENDHDLIIRLYGAYFFLASVSAEVQAIFNDDTAPAKAQTLLIFAPTATTKIEDNTAPVRLVGRIRIFDGANWSPSVEADTFKYQPTKIATEKKE